MRPLQRRGRSVSQRAQRECDPDDGDRRDVAQIPREDRRTYRVTDDDESDLDERGGIRCAEVEADDQRHTDESEQQTGHARQAEMLAVAERRRDHDPDQRNGRDQKPGQRAGDVLLRARKEEPGSRDLDPGEREQGRPPVSDRAPPASRHHEREQDQCGHRSANEHQGGGRDLAHRDTDQEVGDAPDHAHGGKQQKTATGHHDCNLTNGQGLPSRQLTRLDWLRRSSAPAGCGGTFMTKLSAIPIAAACALIAATTALGAGTDVLVSSGSPPAPFSQNKQNEPAIAIDANHPNVLVSGSNDEIDMEACNAGNDTTCPFTQGVGVSGVYFSFDSGQTWTQPTYTGWTGRDCLGTPGADAGCTPNVGSIGTLPWYYENGLVSDGDPAVAFGPKPVNGTFSWANGSRLYYANLTSNFGATRSEEAFKGFEAIAVSRTDDVQSAAAGNKSAWQTPVLVSHQSSTTFSDKEQVWADNASSSPFFGNVYVCWANFVGQEKGNAAPAQLEVAVSSDGGSTWSTHPIGAAANNGQRNPLDGCTIRTDSHEIGRAHV